MPSIDSNKVKAYRNRLDFEMDGRGRGGLSQYRTTKKPHHSLRLQAMGEAGGGLLGNLPAKTLHGGAGETSPSAFAAPYLRSISRSLFVFCFERDPRGRFP